MRGHLGEQRVRRVACRILEHPLEQRVENLSIDRPGRDARAAQVVPADPQVRQLDRIAEEAPAHAPVQGPHRGRVRRRRRPRARIAVQRASATRRKAPAYIRPMRASQRRTCASVGAPARSAARHLRADARATARRAPSPSCVSCLEKRSAVSVRRTVAARHVEEQRRDPVRRPLRARIVPRPRRAAARRASRARRRPDLRQRRHEHRERAHVAPDAAAHRTAAAPAPSSSPAPAARARARAA